MGLVSEIDKTLKSRDATAYNMELFWKHLTAYGQVYNSCIVTL